MEENNKTKISTKVIKKEKKRKRFTKSTNNACFHCKKAHKRCEGKRPCFLCIRNKKDCEVVKIDGKVIAELSQKYCDEEIVPQVANKFKSELCPIQEIYTPISCAQPIQNIATCQICGFFILEKGPECSLCGINSTGENSDLF